MSKTVLVSGAAGFVGRFLLDELLSEGYCVTGLGCEKRPNWLSPEVAWFEADLLDTQSLRNLSSDWWAVVHLAGRTVPSAISNISEAMQNVSMAVSLLEHLLDARFLLVSSALVYEPAFAPRHEKSRVRPKGLYGLSKYLCEQTAWTYDEALDIRIARPFNHLGPGMQPDLAVPSLIRRIVADRKPSEPLKMLGQDSIRDFIDVRDVVRAYIAILSLNRSENAVFNVCTGVPRSIGDIARTAITLAGQTREILFAEQSLSTDDTRRLIGDCTRLKALTEWKPQVGIEDSLQSMIDAGRRLSVVDD